MKNLLIAILVFATCWCVSPVFDHDSVGVSVYGGDPCTHPRKEQKECVQVLNIEETCTNTYETLVAGDPDDRLILGKLITFSGEVYIYEQCSNLTEACEHLESYSVTNDCVKKDGPGGGGGGAPVEGPGS